MLTRVLTGSARKRGVEQEYRAFWCPFSQKKNHCPLKAEKILWLVGPYSVSQTAED